MRPDSRSPPVRSVPPQIRRLLPTSTQQPLASRATWNRTGNGSQRPASASTTKPGSASSPCLHQLTNSFVARPQPIIWGAAGNNGLLPAPRLQAHPDRLHRPGQHARSTGRALSHPPIQLLRAAPRRSARCASNSARSRATRSSRARRLRAMG